MGVFGSVVPAVTSAKLVIVPSGVALPTVTRRSTVAKLPAGRVPRSQETTLVPEQLPWLGVAMFRVTSAGKVAEIAVMGPEGAVNIVFKKEIENAEDQEAERQRLVEEYRNNFASPFRAAELGYIDQIIFPENTRPRLIRALEMLSDKKESIPPRRHGNIPL